MHSVQSAVGSCSQRPVICSMYVSVKTTALTHEPAGLGRVQHDEIMDIARPRVRPAFSTSDLVGHGPPSAVSVLAFRIVR